MEGRYSSNMALDTETRRMDEPTFEAVDYMEVSQIIAVDMDSMEEVVDVYVALERNLGFQIIQDRVIIALRTYL